MKTSSLTILSKAGFILIFSVFVSDITMKGQTLDWSVAQKYNTNIFSAEILGASENAYYLLKYDKKPNQTFIIEKFSKDLRVTGSLNFLIEKGMSVEKIVYLQGRVFVFIKQYDKTKSRYVLNCRVYDDELNLLRDGYHVASTRIKDDRPFIITGDYMRKKLIVLYKDTLSNDTMRFGLVIMDHNLQKIKKAIIPVSGTGTFYIDQLNLYGQTLILLFKAGIQLKPKEKQVHYLLLTYKLDGSSRKIHRFYNDSLKFNELIFKYNPNKDEFLAAGLFSEKDEDEITGISIMKVPFSSDSMLVSNITLPQNLISEVNGKTSKISGIKDYYAKNIILRDDGGIVFIAEQFSIQREVYNDYYSFNNNYIKYYYRFSDLIILSINADYSFDWHKLVRKDQVSANDEGYYSSFFTGVRNDQFVIIYNDNARARWNLMLSSIRPDGNVESKILVNGTSFDGFVVPKSARQVLPDEILIPGYDNKKGFVLLRVGF